MRPSKLFRKLIRLMSLLSSLRRLLEAYRGLFESGSQIRDSLPLLRQDFRRLGDVLEAGIVLVTELAELSTAEEELVYKGGSLNSFSVPEEDS
jgi:hypothetical protein